MCNLICVKFLDIRLPAHLKAPLLPPAKTENSAETATRFPLIVFSHGLCGSFFIYSGTCCDLASHGYVVGSVEHKERSSCIALHRVPGPRVQEGDYDHYTDEFIPFDNTYPMSMPGGVLEIGFELRNRQVHDTA